MGHQTGKSKIGQVIYINTTGDEVVNAGKKGLPTGAIQSILKDIMGLYKSPHLELAGDKNDNGANQERKRVAKEITNKGVN